MNLFDQAVRYLAKGIDPEGFLRWLLPEVFAAWQFVDWIDTRRLPFPGEPDRTCDTVARFERIAGDRPPVAVVIEFAGTPSGRMLPRLGEYCSRVESEIPFHEDPTVRYQVVAAVIYLTGPTQAANWAMRPDDFGGLGSSIDVRSVSMREESAIDLLRRIATGEVSRCLLPWVPLMRGGDTDEVAAEWKRIAEGESDVPLRATYAGLARVLADAADRADFWKKTLEEWQMNESPVILEWIEEGEVKATRKNLKTILETRFGSTLPAELTAMIQAETDLDTLEGWLSRALTAEDLGAFAASADIHTD